MKHSDINLSGGDGAGEVIRFLLAADDRDCKDYGQNPTVSEFHSSPFQTDLVF
jgi:hypothetical protein